MRVFAGPNGSGKSTLKSVLDATLLGVYLNPDEIEQQMRRQCFLDFAAYRITTTADEVLSFFRGSSFLDAEGLGEAAKRLNFANGRLDVSQLDANSYFASVASDFLRQKLLEGRMSFTFETVMSHRSKIEVLAQAQQLGYRTYLYFIATDDPAINVSRVRARVNLGGHPVPEDRIEKRYYRSLDLLMDAIQHTNRAYIFDNSVAKPSAQPSWLAEITDGRELEMKSAQMPAWFQRSVLDKINQPPS